jgi:capsule polysaccharide export protein KpsC/LpsZ
MTEWLERTILHFAGRPDVQLIVRIHPGERYLDGPSVADVARRVLPDVDTNPSTNHIRLLPADASVNTYDLVEIADLGIVYTTTVGLEMGMSGVPVVVGGQTHYRGKGFTLDPNTWEEYSNLLDNAIMNPDAYRLAREQVEQAWNYAYRFFFEYPLPFPWHLSNYWDALEEWPLTHALTDEGWAKFGDTYRCLMGEPRDWTTKQAAERKP